MEMQQTDRRLVVRVLAGWREIAGTRGWPRRSQIDARRFGRDWSHCLLLDVDPEPMASRLAFVGDGLRDPTWPTFDRQSVSECLAGSLLDAAVRRLGRLADERERMSEGAGTHLGAPMLFRSILLPLSEDGERIDGALGAASCRAVA
jgi:hypothetical protein